MSAQVIENDPSTSIPPPVTLRLPTPASAPSYQSMPGPEPIPWGDPTSCGPEGTVTKKVANGTPPPTDRPTTTWPKAYAFATSSTTTKTNPVDTASATLDSIQTIDSPMRTVAGPTEDGTPKLPAATALPDSIQTIDSPMRTIAGPTEDGTPKLPVATALPGSILTMENPLPNAAGPKESDVDTQGPTITSILSMPTPSPRTASGATTTTDVQQSIAADPPTADGTAFMHIAAVTTTIEIEQSIAPGPTEDGTASMHRPSATPNTSEKTYDAPITTGTIAATMPTQLNVVLSTPVDTSPPNTSYAHDGTTYRTIPLTTDTRLPSPAESSIPVTTDTHHFITVEPTQLNMAFTTPEGGLPTSNHTDGKGRTYNSAPPTTDPVTIQTIAAMPNLHFNTTGPGVAPMPTQFISVLATPDTTSLPSSNYTYRKGRDYSTVAPTPGRFNTTGPGAGNIAPMPTQFVTVLATPDSTRPNTSYVDGQGRTHNTAPPTSDGRPEMTSSTLQASHVTVMPRFEYGYASGAVGYYAAEATPAPLNHDSPDISTCGSGSGGSTTCDTPPAPTVAATPLPVNESSDKGTSTFGFEPSSTVNATPMAPTVTATPLPVNESSDKSNSTFSFEPSSTVHATPTPNEAGVGSVGKGWSTAPVESTAGPAFTTMPESTVAAVTSYVHATPAARGVDVGVAGVHGGSAVAVGAMTNLMAVLLVLGAGAWRGKKA